MNEQPKIGECLNAAVTRLAEAARRQRASLMSGTPEKYPDTKAVVRLLDLEAVLASLPDPQSARSVASGSEAGSGENLSAACDTCLGSGLVIVNDNDDEVTCEACGGTGKRIDNAARVHVSYGNPERYFDGDAQAFRYRRKRFETWRENGQQYGRWEWTPWPL